MGPNRLFVPQGMLDLWLSEDRVEVEGDVMVTRPENQRFVLTTAILIKEEVTGTPDEHGLIGKVQDLEQLASLGAEHYADSVILGDNAYQCVEGFAGTPVPTETMVTASSLDAAAKAAVGERTSSGELDLLARFLRAK
ncbi:MAG: hypothetical protein H6719_30990 [Sandaracinaceae bacterium]|nr:hypothetical protein [Sandaracinaceae bacterium]